MPSDTVRRSLDASLGNAGADASRETQSTHGGSLVLLLLREGLNSLLKLLVKAAKALAKSIAAAIRFAWRNRATLVTPLLQIPPVLYKTLVFLGRTKLGKAIIAAATSILCVQLFYNPRSGNAAGGALGAQVSLLFGAVKLGANIDVQLALPGRPLLPWSAWRTQAGTQAGTQAAAADAAAAGAGSGQGRSSLLLQQGGGEREEIRLFCSENFEQQIIRFLRAQAEAAAAAGPCVFNAGPRPDSEQQQQQQQQQQGGGDDDDGGGCGGGPGAGCAPPATASTGPAFRIYSPVKEYPCYMGAGSLKLPSSQAAMAAAGGGEAGDAGPCMHLLTPGADPAAVAAVAGGMQPAYCTDAGMTGAAGATYACGGSAAQAEAEAAGAAAVPAASLMAPVAIRLSDHAAAGSAHSAAVAAEPGDDDWGVNCTAPCTARPTDAPGFTPGANSAGSLARHERAVGGVGALLEGHPSPRAGGVGGLPEVLPSPGRFPGSSHAHDFGLRDGGFPGSSDFAPNGRVGARVGGAGAVGTPGEAGMQLTDAGASPVEWLLKQRQQWWQASSSPSSSSRT